LGAVYKQNWYSPPLVKYILKRIPFSPLPLSICNTYLLKG
jgi:hypothetical protein